MKQQRFDFTGSYQKVTSKEELMHARQIGNTCAYYALAMLTGLPPFEVLKVGSQVLKESRLRKLNGTHDLLIETYRRLGYRFPWKEISCLEPRRAKTVRPSDLGGSGFIRVTPRAKSRSGHLVAYKQCLVYDSDQPEIMHATEYMSFLKRRKKYYVRIIPEAYLERDGNRLTSREHAAQSFLMKRPGRPSIWRW